MRSSSEPVVEFAEDNLSQFSRSESQEIQDEARKILETYHRRLNSVGYNKFQLRLNLFFTFVRDKSVEAEAYDFLQSVEGSVMNHEDASDISEHIYERKMTLSSISDMERNESRSGSLADGNLINNLHDIREE